MATKTSFTSEEWQRLLASPMLAGMAVTAADPSGLIGLVQEGFAASRALAQAKANPATDALIKAVVAEFETADGRGAARDGLKARFGGSRAGDLKPKAIEGCARSARCSRRRRPTMRKPSRPGSRTSPAGSPRPPRRAVFSALAASW
jgi:hypothetical protein